MKRAARKGGRKTQGEYNMIKMHDVIFNVGDTVRVREYCDDECFGRIESIFKAPRGNDAFVSLRWYYKPSDIFTVPHEFLSQFELFLSDNVQDIWVQTIYDKMAVLTFDEYFALESPDEDTYFSRGNYSLYEKTIDPDFSTWQRVCQCDSILNPDVQYVYCDGCGKLFHMKCVGEIDLEGTWMCTHCA